MKVLMKKTNTVEEVNDSYSLNFLIPKGLAVRASREVLARKDKQDAANEAAAAAKKVKESKAADQLDGSELVIKSKANDEGELYGSVTKGQIKKALNLKAKVNVVLKEPIKHLGSYPVRVKVGSNKVLITVKVVAS